MLWSLYYIHSGVPYHVIIIIIIIIIIIFFFYLFFCARKHEACRLKIDVGAMKLCEWSDPYVD